MNHSKEKSFRSNVFLGFLTLGLFISVAAADLVPIGGAARILSCTGTECTQPGSTSKSCSAGSFQDVACCCRTGGSGTWGCSCRWPTDCVTQGGEQYFQAMA